MWLQLVIIFIAIFAIPIFSKNKNGLKKYIVFICGLLILQSGLRHVAVGADTYAYYALFESVKNSTWGELYRNVILYLNGGQDKDPGYPLFVKVVQIFLPEYRLYLLGVALFFFTAFYKITVTYSKTYSDVLLSLGIYYAIYYGFFSITGIRQTIATSIALLSLPYVVKGRFVRFAIPVLFASLIHKSVLLILPLYFLAKVKKTKWLYVGALLLFPVSLKFARQFTLFLADTSGSENYMNYAVSTYETNGAITFSILLVLTAICSILALKTKACQELIADAKYRILFNSVPMAIVLVPLTFVDPTLQRVGQYYSIFIIWLLPIILVSVDKSKTVWHAFFLIILLTIISHNNPYAFMWQDMQLGCNYGGQIINQTI